MGAGWSLRRGGWKMGEDVGGVGREREAMVSQRLED